MAHETLKTLITQNIKTNGQNAITAQILQDVLIAMVDDYPDVSSYLPLSGGTMTGAIDCGSLNTGSYRLWNDGIEFEYGTDARYANSLFIGRERSGYEIMFTARGGGSVGTTIKIDSVTSDSFVKNGGTSDQFLKADGSVDGNTYITASALTDYATKSWVTSQLGSYATQSWVTTQLGGYLPLTGGTLTGDLFTALHKIISITLSEGARRNTYINLGYQQVDGVEYAMNMNVSSSLVPLAGLDLNGVFLGSGYKVTDGTSDEVLCADGSIKTLAELKAALNAI